MAICQFYITDSNGNVTRCSQESKGGVTRCLSLCKSHYNLLKRDNKRRNEKGIEIPTDCSLIVQPSERHIKLCKTPMSKSVYDESVLRENENPIKEDIDDDWVFSGTEFSEDYEDFE